MLYHIQLFVITICLSGLCRAQSISTEPLATATFCQNEEITVDYTVTGSFNPSNIFTVQLSDETGSFASPTLIGNTTSTSDGSIAATLPNLLTTGTLYRVRVVGSDPVTVGSNNGTDLTITGNANDPNTFGNNIWHAYCFNSASYTNNSSAFDFSDYKGMYTENTLDVNSSDYWGTLSNPSTAAGYIGCDVTNDLHLVSYKRKGFPCGNYTISIAGPGGIAGHDDASNLIIDGIEVWSNTGCCNPRNDVWTGLLGPNSEIEFNWAENGGNSYGRLTFVQNDFPTVASNEITICAGTSATLEASGAANYDWTTNSTHLVAPLNTATVDCSPASGTPNSTELYTVSSTDAGSGCVLTNDITVNIEPNANVAITPTSDSYCGAGSTNVLATGAYTYSWSPMTDVTFNNASGNDVTLTPTTTTTYTITGSNNCVTDDETITITVSGGSGDPNSFGASTWNVYCYQGNNFNTYVGDYVHNTLSFDTRTIWGNGASPSDAPGYTGCTIPIDQHSFRYKRKGFDCGYYQLDIPNHDDYVNLIIDGVSVFSQNSWFGNVPKTNVWTGYLDSDSEVEYTIREFGGGSNGGLTFNYIAGPNNSANETVWNGKTDTDWFEPSNWCNNVPSTAISGFIPSNVSNFPEITGSTATVFNLEIQEGATLNLSGTSTLNVYGDIEKNGTFKANTGTVVLAGSNAITISSSNSTLSFHNLTANNNNLVGISLGTLENNKIEISGDFNLSTGVIECGANVVSFLDDATTSNGTDESYINGVVEKVGDDAFTFPVGTSGYYRSIGISAPSNVTDAFTAEFKFESADNIDAGNPSITIDAGITNVSDCEYWNLNRTNGTSDVFVSISYLDYGNGCSGVSDPSSLEIVHYDETADNWDLIPSTAVGLPAGVITSDAVVTNFSPFTLGTTDNNNPLPVTWLSFVTIQKLEYVDLSWSTASEINNEKFIIERSNNGVEFEEIGEVLGSGNSSEELYYEFSDITPFDGRNFYRIKQVDFNGEYEYSSVRSIVYSSNNTGISLYPNPSKDGKINVSIDSKLELFEIKIYDNFGKVIKLIKNPISLSNIDLSEFSNGLYHIQYMDKRQLITKPFIIGQF